MLLLASCTSPPPPDPLVLAKAFTGEHIPGVLNVFGTEGRVIGEDRRPVLAYLPRVDLVTAGDATTIAGGLRQEFVLPPKFRDTPIRVSRRYRKKPSRDWLALPPLLARGGERLAVDFPLADATDPAAFVLFASAGLPRPELTQTFRDLVIGPGAVLIGAYGLDPETAALTTAPVDFRLTARGANVERVLLDVTVDPSAPTAETWTDYRIDLAELAGQTVEVEVKASVRSKDGVEPIAFPMWSVPRILAPKPPGSMLNVVLISIDTLRADFVGAYGHDRDTTPNLDRFAADGALFEHAVAPYPSTTASHMTMLTGLNPEVHGVYAPGGTISNAIRPLADQLTKRGYQTAAITEDGMIAAGAGFARGFADYREYKGLGHDGDKEQHRDGAFLRTDDADLADGLVDEVVDSGIDWLTRHRNQRFFLFLHTYQVHDPYTPPPAYDVFKTYVVDGEERTVDGNAPRAVRARLGYEGDLLYTDSQIARLLDTLDDLGEAERTLVVITADHGEALGEHGVVGHGWYVIEPVLHVPLLMRAPGLIPEGLRVAAPVSLVDVTPTVLELAGVLPTVPMQGMSLAPALTGKGTAVPADRVVYTERGVGEKAMVIARRGDLKWVVEPGKVTRWDLASDPGELQGVAESGGDGEGTRLADAYRAGNDAFRTRLGDARPTKADVDEATQQKLRALGYAE